MYFDATWSDQLSKTTLGVSALLLCLPFLVYGLNVVIKKRSRRHSCMAAVLVGTLTYGILAWTATNTIRGYEVTPGHLEIKRLFHSNHFDLTNLTEAVVHLNAMAGSRRTMGTGGLFSFSGRFRNAKLGTYQAFVTDRRSCVVLTFAHGVVVVSPDNPHLFVDAVTRSR